MKKEVKELRRKLEAQGWRLEDRGSTVMAFSPDGVTVVSIHKTPSDWRAMKNTIARLRRGGFEP